MRVGIAGLPSSGKSTLIAAASAWAHVTRDPQGAAPAAGRTPAGPQQAVVAIPDPRLEWLAGVYRPRKVTPATVEWVELPSLSAGSLPQLLQVDALVWVLRAFDARQTAVPHPEGRVDPAADFRRLWQEWLLLDWAVLDARLERLRHGASVPRAERRQVEQEIQRLERCRAALEAGQSLRQAGLDEADRAALRGYSLVTFLPVLVAVNLDGPAEKTSDGELALQAVRAEAAGRCEAVVGVAARLELELAQLDGETRQAFLRDLGLQPPVGVQRLAQAAYRAVDLICFLTAGEQEVRAWTIRRGTVAKEAAGKVHSDIARGFIRAEVVAFEDLRRAGSLARAREAGLLRLEGKDYVMQDGDVVEFRFHV